VWLLRRSQLTRMRHNCFIFYNIFGPSRRAAHLGIMRAALTVLLLALAATGEHSPAGVTLD
jgi:hypothetical protein